MSRDWFAGWVADRYDEHTVALPVEPLVDVARLAGMRLRDRWSGWQREPFTGKKLVSVWEKPA